jgi:hypothetical protein
MHSFEVSLGYESVDRTTFSTIIEFDATPINQLSYFVTIDNQCIPYRIYIMNNA